MADTFRHDYGAPTLMRSARGAYAQSIRAQLHAIGIDDLPRNGVLVLMGIDSSGGPRTDLPAELGVTKQAVSQVIDTLVTRGYLERRADADDRRRVVLELTERGQDVVHAAFRGMEAVDRQLQERVSPEQIDAMRSVLVALTEIKVDGISTGEGRRRGRTQRQLRRFSPIFPVRDLEAALAHYGALGFDARSIEGGGYGFADRERVQLQLALCPEADDAAPGSTYLYVRDADTLYEEWSRPGIGGETRAVQTTHYGFREGEHVDPDGNVIRFGSPVEE